MWQCHHKVEIIMNCGPKELIAVGAYYDRPAHELIFLTEHDHRSLHSKARRGILHPNFGKHRSEETRRRIGVGNKDKVFSEEAKQKISKALSGRKLTEAHKRKIGDAERGLKNFWFGKHHSEETKRKISEARTGMKPSEETRRKMSEARKGQRWWNNGIRELKAFECPAGFVPGRLKRCKYKRWSNRR